MPARKVDAKYKSKLTRVDWSDHLTTGQIGRMLNVSPGTVSKWCMRGELRNHCVPLSKDRRVFPADLIAFLMRNDFPIPREITQTGRTIAYALPPGEKIPNTTIASDAFDLGSIIERVLVNVAIIGDSDGVSMGVAACRAVKKRHPLSRVIFAVDPSVSVKVESVDVVHFPLDVETLLFPIQKDHS